VALRDDGDAERAEQGSRRSILYYNGPSGDPACFGDVCSGGTIRNGEAPHEVEAVGGEDRGLEHRVEIYDVPAFVVEGR
jgi:hypothetical protein